MKHSIVFTPKHIFTLLAIVLGFSLQASAQSETFAYANNPGSGNKSVRVAPEKNEMARKGCKIDIQQEGAEQLRFLVQIDNPTGEKLTLFIKDVNNNTLHKEVLDVTSPKFVARYNLEKLEDGAYTFEIRNGKNKLEKAVDIKTQLMVNRVVSVE
ncbi:hypothetical protein GFS24_14835 [Chitinophaga sp. SYP-B3965]|uniref:hypothetical protein n=1 Tax=Chitinophaga sp. SYP-B3965 TaxID=2663120 RepID=UPI0012995905|nr:hypothetical protein [Chitinophaga sp. SYP-B3965]MRG46396.1 hypothetical protein [Chitinophaga sp. SYP-B3965]